MDEIKVWLSETFYVEGESPFMVIKTNPVHLYRALDMLRDSFGENLYCLIKFK